MGANELDTHWELNETTEVFGNVVPNTDKKANSIEAALIPQDKTAPIFSTLLIIILILISSYLFYKVKKYRQTLRERLGTRREQLVAFFGPTADLRFKAEIGPKRKCITSAKAELF